MKPSYSISAKLIPVLTAFIFGSSLPVASAQIVDQTRIDQLNELIEQSASVEALKFISESLPSFLELKYLDQDKSGNQSVALKYDWNSSQDWDDDILPTNSGLSISGSKYNAFAKGSYAFADEVESDENSNIGVEYKWRWFPTYFKRLTLEDGESVQQCLLDSAENEDDFDAFETTDADCARQLGFIATTLDYRYFDVDFHANLEGDQKFDQRNYVYGFELNYSQNLGSQTYILNPILTIGLEQVDPKKDIKRQAAFANADSYDRAYAEFGVTSGGIPLLGQEVKLSYSWRYYQELSPDKTIEDANLDSFRYSAFAIQIPTTILPWFEDEGNSFIFTYASGELPLSLQSEQTFSLGWKSDFDIDSLLGLK